MQQIENIQKIHLIANSEILVSENSSVFNLFSARKQWAQYFDKCTTEENRDTCIEMVNSANEQIKTVLGIW